MRKQAQGRYNERKSLNSADYSGPCDTRGSVRKDPSRYKSSFGFTMNSIDVVCLVWAAMAGL